MELPANFMTSSATNPSTTSSTTQPLCAICSSSSSVLPVPSLTHYTTFFLPQSLDHSDMALTVDTDMLRQTFLTNVVGPAYIAHRPSPTPSSRSSSRARARQSSVVNISSTLGSIASDFGVASADGRGFAVAGGVAEAARRARAAGIASVMVEVDRLDQIEPALGGGATHLLLDNMAPPTLREAVTIVAGRVPTEASGGVRLDTIRAIAETGVTYISVGRLTQSAPAADIGLDFTSVGEER